MGNQRIRLAIFASGNGSNAEEIIRYFSGHPHVEVSLILSNRKEAYVLQRAAGHGIPSKVFSRQEFESGNFSTVLTENGITHIVLAGFLWLLPEDILRTFDNKVINIHPSLLPAFGGKGMYGMHVHRAVCESGVKETGISIHLVNAHYDEGQVLFQARCSVTPTDTPETIAEKIHQLEHKFFPKIIDNWCQGKTLPN